jgi:hypothetical protein
MSTVLSGRESSADSSPLTRNPTPTATRASKPPITPIRLPISNELA